MKIVRTAALLLATIMASAIGGLAGATSAIYGGNSTEVLVKVGIGRGAGTLDIWSLPDGAARVAHSAYAFVPPRRMNVGAAYVVALRADGQSCDQMMLKVISADQLHIFAGPFEQAVGRTNEGSIEAGLALLSQEASAMEKWLRSGKARGHTIVPQKVALPACR
ncbi:MAG TPA: hypothetical protein VMS32_10675 [Verrucomicrobiae bacterium]|jgi:hypothetical protein|nr:hypothetical protein [Verrucomicrobiae bacterium]